MKVEIEPGHYVVAVSGGVDSMVLLDMLAKQKGLTLTVAHFDHGIRSDSAEDRKLVQSVAEHFNLPFVYVEGHLGAGASEAVARKARYEFLQKIKESSDAEAIITAHHQDDMIETAILNSIRGTNRRGLTSLRSRKGMVRPLLGVSKQEILDYAAEHNIHWREDSTNVDQTYLRNYIRLVLLPKMSAEQKQKLVHLLSGLAPVNDAIDAELKAFLDAQPQPLALDRAMFIKLPHTVAREVMATFLRAQNIPDIDRKTLERLVIAAKTARYGTVHDVQSGWRLGIVKTGLVLHSSQR